MKKVLYWFATILQILFIITGFVIQILSMKKMGVMRFVVYMNHTLKDLYPIDRIQNIMIGILAVLTVIILILLINKKNNSTVLGKMIFPMVVFLIILTLLSIVFTLGFSTEDYRAYYFINVILAMVTLIQASKIIVYLRK